MRPLWLELLGSSRSLGGFGSIVSRFTSWLDKIAESLLIHLHTSRCVEAGTVDGRNPTAEQLQVIHQKMISCSSRVMFPNISHQSD